MSLINHIGAAGSGCVLSKSIITWNTNEQIGRIAQRLSDLMVSDSFLQHICGPAECRPLAHLFIVDYTQVETKIGALRMQESPNGGRLRIFE